MTRAYSFLILILLSNLSTAATFRVPQDHRSIQAAINLAQPGDTVLVQRGRYQERIQLRAGVVVRSDGDNSRGDKGLRRAEATILDGGGKKGDQPGVLMAEASVLDGFTVTNVGVFDQAVWRKHYDSHGEELADDEGSVQAEGTVPGIRIQGVNCRVVNNIVHHNGDVGVAVVGAAGQDGGKKNKPTAPAIEGNVCYRNLGGGIGVAERAQPTIRGNICQENLRAGIGCRNASPQILSNECSRNIRAGIGCREGAKPIIRGNKCFLNRRAGIGIRMAGTAPIVEDNECYQNEMAGIGSRDQAEPILRNNSCYQNKMAGIGCDGSEPLIVGNTCRANLMAGIGVRGKAKAIIEGNQCLENKLVAIGVTQGSRASIRGNRLLRTGGGAPPIIAVRDGSIAAIDDNRIEGGGVAGVLVQGRATLTDNRFTGRGKKQGNAIWVWEGSNAQVRSNTISGYRSAVTATKAVVAISDNFVRNFQKVAIVVNDSPEPAHVFGNTVFSNDGQAAAVRISGPSGIVSGNVVKGE